MSTAATTDAAAFREVLGRYPTGVALVTAELGDESFGMIVGTFTSVSLDPPLVGFLAAKTSTTWPRLRAAAEFCINVLAAEHEPLCRQFAARSPERFVAGHWRTGTNGAPVLIDAAVSVECSLHSVLDAGDHWFVTGAVTVLAARPSARPLLFFDGGFGELQRSGSAPVESALHDQLSRSIRCAALLQDRVATVAARRGCGWVTIAQVGTEMVVVNGCESTPVSRRGRIVGLRQPFMAPLGTQFAAFTADPTERTDWARRLTTQVSGELASALDVRCSRVRDRGYAVACSPPLYRRLTDLTVARTDRASADIDREIAGVGMQIIAHNDPADLAAVPADVWALHAPVDAGPAVNLSVGLYPRRPLPGTDAEALGAHLVDLTNDLSDFLDGDLSRPEHPSDVRSQR